MGFVVMILSAIIGIAFIVSSVVHMKKQKKKGWCVAEGLLGIAFFLGAIWLGLPH